MIFILLSKCNNYQIIENRQSTVYKSQNIDQSASNFMQKCLPIAIKPSFRSCLNNFQGFKGCPRATEMKLYICTSQSINHQKLIGYFCKVSRKEFHSETWICQERTRCSHLQCNSKQFIFVALGHTENWKSLTNAKSRSTKVYFTLDPIHIVD